jgi:uncharacterized protein HemY
MRYYFIALIIMLTTIGVAYLSGSDLGNVSISYQTFFYETSILNSIIAISLSFLALRLILLIFDLPTFIKLFLQRNHQNKLRSQIKKGIDSLLAMDFNKAIERLNHIAKNSKRGVFIEALGAQIAYFNDMPEHTKKLLSLELPQFPNEKIFIKLLAVDYAIRYKDYDFVKTIILEDESVITCDWGKFLKALYLLKVKEFSQALYFIEKNPLENEEAQVKLLSILFNKLSHSDTLIPYENISPIKPYISKAFLKTAKGVAGLSLFEYRHKHYERAAELVLQFLQLNWSEKLVAQYAEFEKVNNDEKLQFLEGKLKKYPRCHALRYALAQSCKHLGIWGKARSFSDESMKIKSSKKSLIISADLYLREGQYENTLSDLKRASYTLENFNW